jgi:hypothetical protein
MEGSMSVLQERVRQRQRETQADMESHREKQEKTDRGKVFIFDEIKKKQTN